MNIRVWRVLRATLVAALWLALGATAAKAAHDFYRYADHSIYAAVDDSEANIAYSLASSGRYGFPASPVLAAPSTYWQVRPDFEEEDKYQALDTPGFAIHALRDGELYSQAESVPFSL